MMVNMMYFVQTRNPIGISKPKHLAKCLSVLALYGFVSAPPAQAEALDGDALKKLAFSGTWKPTRFGRWKWNKDNSVCLRLAPKDDTCSDIGAWTIEGNVICYKFTWWGATYGIKENCFTVVKAEGGRYEAIYHGTAIDSMFMNFEVLE